MAIVAAAAGFIEVMSAILLTLFINPHPSDQPTTNRATTTYTVHFLSEPRGGGGSQVSGRLLRSPPLLLRLERVVLCISRLSFHLSNPDNVSGRG